MASAAVVDIAVLVIIGGFVGREVAINVGLRVDDKIVAEGGSIFSSSTAPLHAMSKTNNAETRIFVGSLTTWEDLIDRISSSPEAEL